MDDEELDDLLNGYLDGRVGLNPDMADVEFEWVRGNPAFGSDHIFRHNVAEDEVEEVILQTPPEVEAKRHPDHRNRTIFWGATTAGRWLFVSCEDRREGGTRILTPLTAFEPDDGRDYWERQ